MIVVNINQNGVLLKQVNFYNYNRVVIQIVMIQDNNNYHNKNKSNH